MFSLNFSYLCILREVARLCCLPYVACIHEIGDGGEHIYGIEVELTANVVQTTSKTLFFWAQDALHDNFAYEAAALQTLIVLEQLQQFGKGLWHPYFFGKRRKKQLQQFGKGLCHLCQTRKNTSPTRIYAPASSARIDEMQVI
jgi:hypothetical protein